jgi:hypothetical protein
MGSTGMAGGTTIVRAICSDGTASGCYVAGAFTTAGGVTCNNIARWSGSAWSALGGTPGTNDVVYDILLHPNGNLYIAGQFNTVGGATSHRAAYWDGSAWQTMTAQGLNDIAFALILGKDGKVYYSGSFTTGGLVAVDQNAAWDPTTAAWSRVGTGGPSGSNGRMTTLLDGTIVNASSFFDPVSSSSVSAALWNGSAWVRMDPLTLSIAASFVDTAADPAAQAAYLAGTTFTSLGNISVTRGLAYWNGSTYIPIDVSTGSDGYLIQPLPDGSLIVGFNGSVTALAAGVTSVTNGGTSAAYPRISIVGPGQLYSVKNVTTGDALYFNGLTLATGETLVIDLRAGVKSLVSNFRNCLSYLSPASNLATWRLLPGANSVSILCANASATASIVWSERYWSIDGGAP